jgi:DNA-binding CsgD family transcriptional regulator
MLDLSRKMTRVAQEVRAAGLLFRRKGVRKPLVYAHHLTERSCQVLKLLGNSRTIPEIAQQLGISPGTGYNHCTDLRNTLSGGVRLETVRQTTWLWLVGELRIVTPILAGDVELSGVHQSS